MMRKDQLSSTTGLFYYSYKHKEGTLDTVKFYLRLCNMRSIMMIGGL